MFVANNVFKAQHMKQLSPVPFFQEVALRQTDSI